MENKTHSDAIELLRKELTNDFSVTNNLIIQLQNEIICLMNLTNKLLAGLRRNSMNCSKQ